MRYLLTILSLVLLLSTACTKEIDMPTPSEGGDLVLSCILANTPTQKLRLTYSSAVGRGRFFSEVESAKAVLYRDGVEVGSFSKTGYGEWSLEHTPTEGATYRIEVTVDGHEPLSASTIMPRPADVLPVIDASALVTRRFTQRSISTPLWMFALSSSLLDPEYMFSQPKVHEDEHASLFQEIATNHSGADYFNQEGELSTWDKTALDLVLFKYYVRISSMGQVDETGTYTFNVQYPQTEATFLAFRSASVEYDRYLKSVIEKMTFYESEDDPARWFDQSVIYSNITGGLGIFGAYYQTSYYYHHRFIE